MKVVILAGGLGTRIAEDAAITVKSAERYVGRGGRKLEAALAHWKQYAVIYERQYVPQLLDRKSVV